MKTASMVEKENLEKDDAAIKKNIDTINDETLIRLANAPFFREKRQKAIETLERLYQNNKSF